MKDSFQLLPEIRAISHKALGDEPLFSYPEVSEAVSICSAKAIAVLGVEIFRGGAGEYYTESISEYEVELGRNSWPEFVQSNNSMAAAFVADNLDRKDFSYLLTTASFDEFASLSSQPLRV